MSPHSPRPVIACLEEDCVIRRFLLRKSQSSKKTRSFVSLSLLLTSTDDDDQLGESPPNLSHNSLF